MRAYIYTGGAIDPTHITEHPKGEDLLIAADGGWNNAVTLGERPSVLLGDLDSLDGDVPKDVELFRVPAEKDLTDTQLAVELALQRGAREIVIIGGLSGRLDHTLSNLAILEHLNALRGGVGALVKLTRQVLYGEHRSALCIQLTGHDIQLRLREYRSDRLVKQLFSNILNVVAVEQAYARQIADAEKVRELREERICLVRQFFFLFNEYSVYHDYSLYAFIARAPISWR